MLGHFLSFPFSFFLPSPHSLLLLRTGCQSRSHLVSHGSASSAEESHFSRVQAKISLTALEEEGDTGDSKEEKLHCV